MMDSNVYRLHDAPWVCGDSQWITHKTSGMGYQFREISSHKDDVRIAWVFCDDEFDSENAELISAAPELFDACRYALRALNVAARFPVGDTDSYAIASMCDRALRKAAGELVAEEG
jgi:hypothetical protein